MSAAISGTHLHACRSAHAGNVLTLDLQLRAELHDLLGRHAEERGGAFGVALQEGEHRFPPQPHAWNVLAQDNGFAADIIGDVGEVDARQLVLLADENQSLVIVGYCMKP